jgi:putative ABC transport system ATP-binding protein
MARFSPLDRTGYRSKREIGTLVIDIKDLEFRWRPDTPTVLSIPELQVAQGERLFIKGPSGSGKSTLLSLLSGVTTAAAGTVRVMDQALEGLGSVQRDHFRANHIGYIFQMFNLIPYLSVVDNVMLPCRFSASRRARASKRGNDLEAEARRLLHHLDMSHPDLYRRAVTTLSVGQQQRVAAARALMGSPELLIADEPTSSLDADRRESFIRLLFDECREAGATLVFVSHDASLERLFDRAIDLAAINRSCHETGDA